MHARGKGRRAAAEGYAYLSCHYVIALQVRDRPSSKHAALFQRNNHQGDEEGGCTSHHISEDAGSLVALLSAQPARAYTLARCLSLLLALSYRLCPSFLFSLLSFELFSSCVSRARERNALRHLAWPESLAGEWQGWLDPLVPDGVFLFSRDRSWPRRRRRCPCPCSRSRSRPYPCPCRSRGAAPRSVPLARTYVRDENEERTTPSVISRYIAIKARPPLAGRPCTAVPPGQTGVRTSASENGGATSAGAAARTYV